VRKFVSRPLKPAGAEFLSSAAGNGPPVPRAFTWGGRTLKIAGVLRTWRSTKTDRGDSYLKRHWYELETEDGARIEVYYDREAHRGAAQWWLYVIDE
jgi:hypothetical protein